MRVKLAITLRSSDSLTPGELDEIWAVTDRYVETSRDYFEAKLRALPEVGLWRTESGALIGLVSLDVYRVRWEERTSIILFTSSVVIDDRFRGRDLVLRTGMKLLIREKLRRPWARAYWLFDTFSYKSYMILPRNLAEFWPRRNQATPAPVARFIDFLALRRYGDDWSRETGVVRRSGKKRLRPDTAPVTHHQLTNEDIRFYESVNPGHRDGDMLVCLVPLNARNLRGLVARKLRNLRSRPARLPVEGSKGDRRSTEIPAVLPSSPHPDATTRR
jgi:hypothetical protein